MTFSIQKIPFPFLARLAMVGFLVAGSSSVMATDDDSDPFGPAQAIIADLQKIVTPNGIQETFDLEIGGIDQWVSVRGKDQSNPLLVFVHGGPASPAMPVSWAFQYPWEEYFTVVQWDQRGAGKTYLANDPEKVSPTIEIDQFVDDLVELIDVLRDKYGKEKVVLVGHSWGTIIGLKAALRHPDLVYAYVGIGQVVSVRENERVSFEFALESARREDNQEAIRDLESLVPYPGEEPLTREEIVLQRKWAQHYGGLTAYRDEDSFYFSLPRLSPLYDEADRKAIDKGSVLTLDKVLQEWAEVDFREVDEVPFPIMMFLGRHDYTTPSEPTADWLRALKAPAKHAIWFEHSSHLIPWEEPGKTLLSLVQMVRPYAVSEQ